MMRRRGVGMLEAAASIVIFSIVAAMVLVTAARLSLAAADSEMRSEALAALDGQVAQIATNSWADLVDGLSSSDLPNNYSLDANQSAIFVGPLLIETPVAWTIDTSNSDTWVIVTATVALPDRSGDVTLSATNHIWSPTSSIIVE
ncbi:MAG TPA: type II secretion system protein [Acidimicrobiia bacterium]|nr:type II secretion system protein [Acidimicrobiia bacterium]